MSVVKKLLDGPDMLGVLKRIAESGIGPVSVEKKLCLNFRWRTSCSLCAGLCPSSAIELGSLKIDSSKCTACGVCEPACPAGALNFGGRPRAAIFDEVESMLEKGDIVRFACDRCGGALGRARRAKGAVVVPCLSMLDEAHLLECYARGAREVRLQGCSPDCRFERGKEMFKEAERIAAELRCSLVLKKFPSRAARAKSAETAAAPGLPHRRAFIAGAGRELLRAAYPPDAPMENEERWSWMHRLPERRERLLSLIERPAAGRRPIERSAGMQFGAIGVDGALCSMCGVCGALCPTGSMGTVELDDCSLLYFNPGWCTGCLLCVRACPEKALRADDRVDPASLAGKGAVLLRLGAARCGVCRGRYIPRRTGGECPVCRKHGAARGPSSESISGANHQNI